MVKLSQDLTTEQLYTVHGSRYVILAYTSTIYFRRVSVHQPAPQDKSHPYILHLMARQGRNLYQCSRIQKKITLAHASCSQAISYCTSTLNVMVDWLAFLPGFVQSDSKLPSVFPYIDHGNPANNLESYCIWALRKARLIASTWFSSAPSIIVGLS
jgi:hypothetical protein